MPETAKKAAASKPDETEQEADTSGNLTTKHGHKVDQRETGDVHDYEFADGSSAKVWTGPDKGHYSMIVKDAAGRGLSSDLSENITTAQVNKLIDAAAHRADDAVKARTES
jgi:hypothetical protein